MAEWCNRGESSLDWKWFWETSPFVSTTLIQSCGSLLSPKKSHVGRVWKMKVKQGSLGLSVCLFVTEVKPNYFKKRRSSSSFLLTWCRYTVPKWPWSLSRLVPCLKWMELGCQVLIGHFGPVYLLQVSKNVDEECCS